LVARIRQVLKTELGIRQLFQAPTVATITTQLEDTSGDNSSTMNVLLPLRSDGYREPLFCVHPAAGIGWGYAPLTRYVPGDRPVYGLQARGLDGTRYFPGSIREMAEDYIAQMRTVQKSGPYHILGWSLGGVVAHETAVQLQNAGEKVGALVLLDAYPRDRDAAPPALAETRTVGAELVEIAQGIGIELGSAAKEIGIAELARLIQRNGGVYSELSSGDIQAIARILQNNRDIMATHEPGVFTGDMLLVSAAEGQTAHVPDAQNWQPYIDGALAEVALSCRHEDMIRPDVLEQVWAAVVRQYGDIQ
ncbi:alpha/beta fold hydrolase, partial [Streptomyces sp. NPDC005322]|uniref:alpha/beta fold hydrolase n=1 Tax=Streptomyces sp. NPDC005322 TaxID=3157032 RepID=UPI0033B4964E